MNVVSPVVLAFAVGTSLVSVLASPQTTVVVAGDATQLDTTQPKLRLGHYSSGDGMTGFVLDRTGTPVKLKLDGSSEILALSPAGPRAGAWSTTRLENGLGRTLVEVDEYGGVRYFADGQGEGVRMHRDAAGYELADPQPTPFASPRTVTEWTTKVREACSTPVVFQVDLASMGGADEPLRNAYWQMARAATELIRTCRDAIGQKAVAAKLKTVRIRNVAATAKKVGHEGSTLVLEQPFTTTKGATLKEIATVLSEWL